MASIFVVRNSNFNFDFNIVCTLDIFKVNIKKGSQLKK